MSGLAAAKTPEEGVCELCNVEYGVWFAPNPIWNKIMRHPDGKEVSEKYNFVCPNCFIRTAEALGIHRVWELHSDPDKGENWTIEVPVLKHIQIRATGHEKGEYHSWSSPLLDAKNLPLKLLPMHPNKEAPDPKLNKKDM